jgi:hypothetical protein
MGGKRERIRPWAWIEETDWVLSNGGTRISYHAAVPFPSVWQWLTPMPHTRYHFSA